MGLKGLSVDNGGVTFFEKVFIADSLRYGREQYQASFQYCNISGKDLNLGINLD